MSLLPPVPRLRVRAVSARVLKGLSIDTRCVRRVSLQCPPPAYTPDPLWVLVSASDAAQQFLLCLVHELHEVAIGYGVWIWLVDGPSDIQAESVWAARRASMARCLASRLALARSSWMRWRSLREPGCLWLRH